ncbi:MAG: hypothetical protein CME64_07125 [Halobacteriovoraceae bacterium]|nr:hypothetical protein [Halobacteriovoraceae bacterium]|tara:strand:+ start:48955 stop:49830 length:876 start_codon:yes stop_codon:yes gene_type:complete
MKAFKKITFTMAFVSAAAIFGSGSYNSMVMRDTAFMKSDSGIKFAKRLDEYNGKVVVGRMAASTPKWTQLSDVKEVVVEEQKVEAPKDLIKESEVQKQEEVAIHNNEYVEPAIKGDLDMKVTNVFFKKAIKEGEFSGSAKSYDGVVEEIYVNIPGSAPIEINTRERMEGNVFVYEDSATGEEARGMFYEVKKGTYMITLTNDSQYAGLRMELEAQGEAEVAYEEGYYDRNAGWTTDSQNLDDEYAQNDFDQDENYDEYDQNYDSDYDAQYDQYEYQDNADKEGEFGFNFQV